MNYGQKHLNDAHYVKTKAQSGKPGLELFPDGNSNESLYHAGDGGSI